MGEPERIGSARPDGGETADVLARLMVTVGWGALDRSTLETGNARQVTDADRAAARDVGGTIRTLAFASRRGEGIDAFAGPAFLPLSNPLAGLTDTTSAIRLDGPELSHLFFSAAGARGDRAMSSFIPRVLHSTTSQAPEDLSSPHRAGTLPSRAPITRWFVRAWFSGLVPGEEAIWRLVADVGLSVEQIVHGPHPDTRWLLVGPLSRAVIDAAAERLRAIHRIDTSAIRCLELEHPCIDRPSNLRRSIVERSANIR